MKKLSGCTILLVDDTEENIDILVDEILEVKARVKTHLSLTLARHELANQKESLEERVVEDREALYRPYGEIQ